MTCSFRAYHICSQTEESQAITKLTNIYKLEENSQHDYTHKVVYAKRIIRISNQNILAGIPKVNTIVI